MLLRRESKVLGLAGLAVLATAATLTVLPSLRSDPAAAGPGGPSRQRAGSSRDPGTLRPVEVRTAGRPNLLLITADDAARGDLAFMPHVQRLVADQGVRSSTGSRPRRSASRAGPPC